MKQKKLKLKQIASVNVGYPFRGKIPEALNADIAVVQMKNISPSKGVDWASCLKTELLGRRQPDWLQSGDILFVARGGHNYAVLVDEQLGLEKIQAVAAPHFYVIRCNVKKILPQYLLWFLNQTVCQQYFEQQAEGSLAKSIRRGVLENTPIALPSLANQQAIGNLARILQREQNLLEKLIQNGSDLLKMIAHDLVNEEPN